MLYEDSQGAEKRAASVTLVVRDFLNFYHHQAAPKNAPKERPKRTTHLEAFADYRKMILN